MKTKLETIKTWIEIVAIMFAGIFAFFTWGLDYLSLQNPNWDLFLDNTNQYTVVEKNGINKPCFDSACEITGCSINATLKVINRGYRPIALKRTFINLYFIERNKLNRLVVNSAYDYAKKTREISGRGLEPDTSFVVDEIDRQPVFPSQEGWRPFSFDINPLRFSRKETLADFASKNVLLIIVNQVVEPKVLRPKLDSSRLTYLFTNICNLNNIDKSSHIKKK